MNEKPKKVRSVNLISNHDQRITSIVDRETGEVLCHVGQMGFTEIKDGIEHQKGFLCGMALHGKNPRDVHFAGFAKYIVEEILSVYDGLLMYSPEFWRDQGVRICVERIVARRAYDLMDHVISHAPQDPNLDDWSIPDLTSFTGHEE